MQAIAGSRLLLSISAVGLLVATVAAKPVSFEATAYTDPGVTASGTRTREGTVAADPDVLPLGSRIRLHDAGAYDGIYIVRDTGQKIQGRIVDLYIADDAEAKRFGRRPVRVEVLRRGGAKEPGPATR